MRKKPTRVTDFLDRMEKGWVAECAQYLNDADISERPENCKTCPIRPDCPLYYDGEPEEKP